MKRILITVFAVFCCGSSMLFAEGKGDGDWAEKAAQQYEQKAELADKQGKPDAAAIYRRMAQIKRDAGAASKEGRDFDWAEYHALNEKLQQMTSTKSGECRDAKGEGHKGKPEAGKADPGQGFLDAAAEYQRLGEQAIKQADAAKAQIYLELAEIKRKAAQAARDGKDFNWDRYHELKGRL